MFRLFFSLDARERSLVIAAGAFAIVAMIILALFVYFSPGGTKDTGFPTAQTREEQLEVIASLRALSAETPPVEESVRERVREDINTLEESREEVSESEKEKIRMSLRLQ